MTQALKEEVRRILFLQLKTDITYKQLSEFSGIKHIRVNCFNVNPNTGRSNKCELTLFRYKINMICEATNDAKEIIDILEDEPSDTELADYFGVSQQTISESRVKAETDSTSYAYAFHRAAYNIEKIAELTGA